MDSIISRRFTQKDKKKLNELYNFVFNRSRTIENFNWEFTNNPQGAMYSWVLEDSKSYRIIGHYGLIPIEFIYFGKTVLAGKTENTMLHPQYRSRGLYQPFEVSCIHKASQIFSLIWVSYSAATTTHAKAGYILVGELILYIYINKTSITRILENSIKDRISNGIISIFLQKLSQPIAHIFAFLFSKNIVIDSEIKLEKVKTIDSIAKKIIELWDNVKANYGITVQRSIPYLQWRIFDNPYLKYEFYIALKQGKVVGYVIIRIANNGENKRGIIVDILVADQKSKMLDSILSQAITIFFKRGVYQIEFPTLKSTNFINKALKRNGFVSFSMLKKVMRKTTSKEYKGSLLMVKALDDKLDPTKVSNPAYWYFTNIVTEGIS